MKIKYGDMIYRVNCLASDLDSLYHQAALKLGLSDSVMFVLYLVFESGGECPLNEICKKTGISKQTLNSAVRKLESENYIYLKQTGGRPKNVCLTEDGKEYTEQTVARLFSAECGVFKSWTDEEIHRYLSLMEKYNDGFRKQIEKM